MRTLTITQIPETVHDRLVRQASIHHATVNDEVIGILKQAVIPSETERPDKDEVLARIRAGRQAMKCPALSIEEIETFINEGRH